MTDGKTVTIHRGIVVAALMMAMSLTALDSTVVGTAMPTIVGTLGGIAVFSWVFSVYLLTSTVTVPLYGKLADLYGRKPVLLAGAAIFLVGSALCGTAQNMTQLILFRAIQGLGAGAVQPVTMTIIGDIFSIEERAKIQGFFGLVWGVSSIMGPTIGGVITDRASWRWVFYVNLPLGIAFLALLWVFYRERIQRTRHVIDYLGSVLLAGSIAILLIALTEGVKSFGWVSPQTVGLLVLSLSLLALFVRQEARAPEPTVPLWLFRNRIIAIASAVMFMSGAVLFGISAYVPLFAQGVQGGTAINAGLVVAPVSIGWVIASNISGRLILRAGYYPSGLAGAVFLTLGSLLLLSLVRTTPQWLTMTAVFIIGLGMGFNTSTFTISVQNAVAWAQRGIATAAIQFFRTIGGSIVVAVMGAILNSRTAALEAAGGANVLLNPETRAGFAPDVLAAMQDVLAAGLHQIYFLLLAAAAISFIAVWFFPRGRVQELSHAAPVPAAVPATSAEHVSRPHPIDAD
jgi:EmrB/QacA subfamily drug resistance transporter